MKIYLIQFTDENNKEIGTPYLTADEGLALQTLETCRKQGHHAYTHVYEVKTQGKNFCSYAVAQYHNETEKPF